MKKRRLGQSLLASAVVATAVAWQTSAAQETAFSAVAKAADAARQRMGAPGLSVAVVQNDRLVWSSGFGVADVENQVPARADTVYRIASISKPIAATAIMQLVERGLVSLDDPIQKYVPAFPRKGDTAITLRHILTHTSGIRHYREGEMANPRRYRSVNEAIEIFRDDPLTFTPGAKYSYSSYAYNLLAGVVEQASGLTYESYLRERIFDPAGMTATRLERPEDIVPHRARQYDKDGTGGRVLNAPYADLSVKWAGGGVISTVEDLARFHVALNTGRLLGPETLRLMYTPARLADGKETTYGLGWQISRDGGGRTWIAHGGGATGGSTYLLRNPEAKLAVAIMCNVANAGNLRALALEIAELVERRPSSAALQGCCAPVVQPFRAAASSEQLAPAPRE